MMDYQMAREDDRTFSNIQTAVAGFVVALLAALAAVINGTCQLDPGNTCHKVPDLFLAVAPSIPFGALAFLQLLGTLASLRSYYTRGVERELRKHAGTPLTEFASLAPITAPSYAGLITEVHTMRRGHTAYRFLSLAILFITLGVFLGLTLYIAFHLSPTYRDVMVTVYGGAFLFLFADVASATLGARSSFIGVARRFEIRQHKALLDGADLTVSNQRSLGSYLLLPRPEDWSKWVFIPLAYIVATLAQHQRFHWGPPLLALLLIEYLLYSARYQMNDIRGYGDDAGHPHAAARFRLPHPPTSKSHRRFNVFTSMTVAILRVLTALLIAVWLGQATAVSVALGVITVTAVLYEYLRGAEASALPLTGGGAAARTLWVLVGSGYALRFLVGTYAAGMVATKPIAYLGAAFAFCVGIMFVLLTWALEATSHCRATPVAWYTGSRLDRKPHLRLLLKYVRSRAIDMSISDPAPTDPSIEVCTEVNVLAGEAAPLAPWNFAYWATCAIGVLLGDQLARISIISQVSLVEALLVVGGATFVSLTKTTRKRLVAAATVTAAQLAAAYLLAAWQTPALAVWLLIPWLCGSGCYILFRQQSYKDLKYFAQQISRQARGLIIATMKKAVGSDTWTDIT
jgi:hypothetical protein